MEESISERYADDILSDNTHRNICRQCKNCRFWGNADDPFRNAYDKACCDMYPYPSYKPQGVVDNTEACEYKKPRD